MLSKEFNRRLPLVYDTERPPLVNITMGMSLEFLCSCYAGFPKDLAKANLQTHIHPFNGPLSGTTGVSRYQNGKTNLDFTEARDSEWQ